MLRILVLLIILLSSCSSGIYDLTFKDLSGEEVSLRQYRGKKLIVYVWSGTCVGHTEDLKRLVKIYPKLKGKSELVSIAVMMDSEDALQVLRSNGINPNYPVLVDPRGDFAEKVTLLFLPATIIFDERGEPVENYPRLPENLISLVSSHR